MQHHRQYINAGFRVMRLYPVVDGQCSCENPECKNLYKHPMQRNWTHTVPLDEDALRTYEEYGLLDQGFGVLVDDHLVIDIDPRNGGDESFKELCSDLKVDLKSESSFIVKTGGGGWHIYFKRESNERLAGHLMQYPGIDFKSSGYIVGAGSLHASGNLYEPVGDIAKIGRPPEPLLDLLRRSQNTAHNTATAYSDEQLESMLSHISPDCDYQKWVQIGMALHHATGGEGFELWDKWSSEGAGYDRDQMDPKWHSFGKSDSPVTAGTLKHYAVQNGYVEPVTFEMPEVSTVVSDVVDSNFDLNNPPGLAGRICELIAGSAYRPIPQLYPIAALQIMSLCAKGSYTRYTRRLNLLTLGIALSAAGKENPQNIVRSLSAKLGLGSSLFGGAGSFKDFIINLLDSGGLTLYAIDEIHSMFNSMGSKNANTYESKMEAEILTMSSTKLYTFRGVEKREFSEKINNYIARLNRRIDEGEDGLEEQLKFAEEKLDWVINGLPDPHFSLMGHSTPDNLDSLINYHNIGTGLLGRMLVVRCNEYRAQLNIDGRLSPLQERKLEDDIVYRLKMIRAHEGEFTHAAETRPLLQYILDYYEDDDQRNHPVLGALYARCYEQVLKISSILALDCLEVRPEHVKYAFALVEQSIADIAYLLSKNQVESEGGNGSGLYAHLKDTLTRNCGEGGMTPSRAKYIIQRSKGFQRYARGEDAEAMAQTLLDKIVTDGDLILEEDGRKKRYKKPLL